MTPREVSLISDPVRTGVVDTLPDPMTGAGRVWAGTFYRYKLEDWIGPGSPRPGQRVTFLPRGTCATYVRCRDAEDKGDR